MSFTVTYAVYGALPAAISTEAKAFNVASQLNAILNAPGATGVVKCDNFLGGDPAPGNVKHFGAIVNGRCFACQEGQAIDFNHGGGVLDSGEVTPTSDIVIQFAVYGALLEGLETGAKAFDVTGRVQDIANRFSGYVGCDNTVFGDPAPGSQKHFAVVVTRGGQDLCFACAENQVIDFNKGGGTQ